MALVLPRSLGTHTGALLPDLLTAYISSKLVCFTLFSESDFLTELKAR